MLRPVRQPAAGSGDDRHSGTGDLPGLVPTVGGAAAEATRSGQTRLGSSRSSEQNRCGSGSAAAEQFEENA